MKRMLTGRRGTLLILVMLTSIACMAVPFFAPQPVAKPTPQPNPLNVSVIEDANHTASALIAPDTGGQISVTAGDGTKFTLNLPKNALFSEETVTLTVVSAVNGSPLKDGIDAAVKIEPDGLQLLEPATLTIRLPKPVDPKSLLGFGYRAEGQEFHLEPYRLDGSVLTFHLLHFSGYGAGQGNTADASKVVPTAAADRAAQALAVCFSEGGDNCDANSTNNILEDWYSSAVLPEMTVAVTDDNALDGALIEWLQWERAIQMMGLPDNAFSKEQQTLGQLLPKAIQNAINKSFERCVQNNNVSEVIVMLRRAVLAQKLGLSDSIMNDALDKVQKCARFELDLDSTMQAQSKDGPVTAHVQATVPLRFDPSRGSISEYFTGEGDLKYVDITWPQVPNCSFSPTPGSSTKISVLARFNLNLRANAQGDVNIQDNSQTPIFVGLQLSRLSATVTVTCKGFSQQFSNMDTWTPTWAIFHHDELACSGGNDCMYWLRDWTVLNGSIYATKAYQRSQSVMSETTTVDIKHTPQP